MQWAHYFRNEDETPPVCFFINYLDAVFVLDQTSHQLVAKNDYLMDEYEDDGETITFASDNIVEVSEMEFDHEQARERVKDEHRWVIPTDCYYFGPDVPDHLHHDWWYQGEQMWADHFHYQDEANEWHEFDAELVRENIFILHKGSDWQTSTFGGMARPSDVKIFNEPHCGPINKPSVKQLKKERRARLDKKRKNK